MAFDITQTPITGWVSNLAGYITKRTETNIDNRIIEELKAALDQASDYEGDLEDLLHEFFDVVEWGMNEIPVFQATMIDDILLPYIESSTIALLTGSGNFGFVKMIIDRIKANKEKRQQRRKERKEKRKS